MIFINFPIKPTEDIYYLLEHTYLKKSLEFKGQPMESRKKVP